MPDRTSLTLCLGYDIKQQSHPSIALSNRLGIFLVFIKYSADAKMRFLDARTQMRRARNDIMYSLNGDDFLCLKITPDLEKIGGYLMFYNYCNLAAISSIS